MPSLVQSFFSWRATSVFHRQGAGTGFERAALFLVLLSGPAGAVRAQPLPAVAGAQNKRDVLTRPQPSTAGTPEVTAVEPPRVARGSAVSLKVKGKNFAQGAKVCFSNPAILVLESKTSKSTELTARLQVPADAPTGATSLFVANPDERDVEVPFEVTDGGTQTAQKPASTPAAGGAGSAALRFEVLNLAEAASILQDPDKAKGMLSLVAGKLQYEEGGAKLFSAAPREIKEIAPNVILGINTGTFHVILDSGKTYNFVAASLSPADSQSIVDSLRRALP